MVMFVQFIDLTGTCMLLVSYIKILTISSLYMYHFLKIIRQ